MIRTPRSLGRVFTLSTKLNTIMSLVVIVGSMCIGLYFLEMQVRSQTKALMHTGTLLAQNLAHNGRYPLIIQDTVGLQQLIAGVLPVRESVYVIFSDSSGQILANHSKGTLTNQSDLGRSVTMPLFANTSLRQQLLTHPSPGVTITPFRLSQKGEERLPTNHGKAGRTLTTFFTQQSETLYDFSVPILRSDPQVRLDPSLSFELQSDSNGPPLPEGEMPPVYGLIQIGLSDAHLQQELQAIVWQGIVIIGFIVLTGLVIIIMASRQMTVPLKSLAHHVALVPQGHLSPLPPSDSEDEIGQLTTSFNHMVHALRQEKLAVEQQISRLTTINTVGTSLAASSSLDELLSTALEQLVEQSDFQYAVLGLFDSEQAILSSLHSSGFSPTVLSETSTEEISVQDDGGLWARVLLHHQSLVAHDLTMLSSPYDLPLFKLLERQGICSFLIVPLESDQQILGFLAVARSVVRCQQEDLALLHPIATKLSIAIDRAHAYLALEELTHTLERRVEERTEELQTANEKLKDLDRLKSTFVSIASHELRTPLTSIKVLVENLFRGVYGPMLPEQTQHLDRVRINVDRLRRMISELLDLTQIETGRMKLSFTSVSLIDLVREAIDNLSPLAQDKFLSLRYTSPPEVPTVMGDRDKIFQILTNLIHNAVKFTENAGEIIVTIGCREDGQIEVCVADSGCGISPEELGNIFLPFYRSAAKTSDNRGAGLGLALTRHLVELHKGHLWAESTPNQGSRFYFTLPVEPQHNPALV